MRNTFTLNVVKAVLSFLGVLLGFVFVAQGIQDRAAELVWFGVSGVFCCTLSASFSLLLAALCWDNEHSKERIND